MRNIVNNNAIDDIIIGNTVPMPWKNGIQLSIDWTRSCMDDSDNNGGDGGNRVGRRKDQ